MKAKDALPEASRRDSLRGFSEHLKSSVGNWVTAYECGMQLRLPAAEGLQDKEIQVNSGSKLDSSIKRQLLETIRDALKSHYQCEIPIVTDLAPYWREDPPGYTVPGMMIIACDFKNPVTSHGHLFVFTKSHGPINILSGDLAIAILSDRCSGGKHGFMKIEGSLITFVHPSVVYNVSNITCGGLYGHTKNTCGTVLDSAGTHVFKDPVVVEAIPLNVTCPTSACFMASIELNRVS